MKRKLLLLTALTVGYCAYGATFTVSNLNDNGAGSLRQAITDANNTSGADNIDFSIAGTITLSSALPNVTEALSINGNTAPGYSSLPVVVVSGNYSFTVYSTTNFTLTGVEFNSPNWDNGYGVYLNTCTNAVVQNCKFVNKTIAVFGSNGTDIQALNNKLYSCGSSSTNACFRFENVSSSTLPKGVVMTGNRVTGGSGNSFLYMSSMANQIISDGSVANTNITITSSDSITNRIANDHVIRLNSCANVIIKGLDLSRSSAQAGLGISLYTCDNSNISYVTVNNRSGGIYLSNCNTAEISYVNMTSNVYGIQVSNGKDMHVHHCSFTGVGNDANSPTLRFDNVTANTLPKGVSVHDITLTHGDYSHSLLRLNSMHDQIVSDGTVAGTNIVLPDLKNKYDNDWVIRMDNCNNPIIRNFDISRSAAQAGGGIYLYNCPNDSINNITINNRTGGIYLNSCDKSEVSNISMTSNIYGVLVSNGKDAHVHHCSFTGVGNDVNSPTLRFDNVTANTLTKGVSVHDITLAHGDYSHSLLRLNSMHNQIVSDGAVAGTNIILPDLKNKYDNDWVIRMDNCNNPIIRNFDLSRSTAQAGGGIYLYNCPNDSISNITVNKRTGGIYLNSCDKSEVSNVSMTSNVYGVLVSNGKDAHVHHCSFTGVGNDANSPTLRFDNVTANTLPKGVSVHDITLAHGDYSHSLLRLNSMHNQIVSDGAVAGTNIVLPDLKNKYDNGWVFYMENCNNPIIRNFDLSRSVAQAGGGIYLYNCPNDSISNITINNRSGGIYLNSCDKSEVSNVSMTNNNYGVLVSNGKDAHVHHCSFTGVGNDANSPTLRFDNVTANTLTKGVSVHDITLAHGDYSHSLLRLNSMHNQIVSDGAVAGTNIVLPNMKDVYDNDWVIYMENCNNPIIRNLDLSRSVAQAGGGIYMYNCPNDSIANMTVNNRTGGIHLNSCNKSEVSNVSMTNNIYGIYVSSGQDAHIHHNTLTGCGNDANSTALRFDNVAANTLASAIFLHNNKFISGAYSNYGIRINGTNNQIISDSSVANTNIVIHSGDGLNIFYRPIYLSSNTGSSINNLNLSYLKGGIQGEGIYLESCTNISVSKTSICSRSNGIFITNSTGTSISCTDLTNNNNGVYSSNDFTISNSTLDQNGTDIDQANNTATAINNYWNGSPVTSGTVNTSPVLNAQDVCVVGLPGSVYANVSSKAGLEGFTCGTNKTDSIYVSASCVTSSATLTPTSNFEISLDKTSWSNSITLSQSGGTLNSQPVKVYVRIANGQPLGAVNGTLSMTANSASPNTIALSGTVVTATVPVTLNSAGQTNVSCHGGSDGSATVSATGGSSFTYDWEPGTPAGDGTATVTGLTAGTWTCTVTNNCGGSNTYAFTITQPAAPLSVTFNASTICAGSSTTLTASATGGTGAVSYTWTPGNTTGTTNTVSPIATTSYTVLAKDANGCMAYGYGMVTVNPLPTVTVNSGTICAGETFTITPSGASTYTIQGNSYTVSPLVTTTYAVYGTSADGCISNGAVTCTVTVNPIPTITVNSGSICAGETFTITPSGASTYTIQGNSYTVSPLVTTTYAVYGTSADGCISNGAVTCTVTVNPTPTITVNSGSICAGETFTITPSGASTYTIQGNSYTVSPLVTTTYAVYGTSVDGCISNGAATCTVTVNPTPTITVNSGTICAGETFTITPSGASTYTIQGNSYTVSPLVTSTYAVYGTSVDGCISNGAATCTVTVNPTPTINITSDFPGYLCAGGTASLTADGADTYLWNTGDSTATIVVSPTITTSYSVTGIDINGCVAEGTITQLVSVCTAVPTVGPGSTNAIVVYPNPGMGIYTLELANTTRLTIYDMMGKVVLDKIYIAGRHTLDISQQPTGVYLIKTINEGVISLQRLIKE